MGKFFLPMMLFYTLVAQTTTNPDISIIGDVLIVHNDTTYFSDSGIELAFQGYVNPFAKASVYFHYHGAEGIELEEAYLAIERGLPLGLGLKAGVMRPSFGKMNSEHAHTFPFIESPLSVRAALGPEHWWSNGVEINLLLPVLWYSQLAVFVGGDNINPQPLTTADLPQRETVAGTVRWSNFFDLTPYTHLELGMSRYGEKPGENRLTGWDIKLKRRPDKYRSFTWQTEWFRPSGPHLDMRSAGYSWLNMQFNKRWNLGLILDAIRTNNGNIHGGWGIFAGFSPVEESSVLRVKLERPAYPDDVSSLAGSLQLIWSLGPHKPHRF